MLRIYAGRAIAGMADIEFVRNWNLIMKLPRISRRLYLRASLSGSLGSSGTNQIQLPIAMRILAADPGPAIIHASPVNIFPKTFSYEWSAFKQRADLFHSHLKELVAGTPRWVGLVSFRSSPQFKFALSPARCQA